MLVVTVCIFSVLGCENIPAVYVGFAVPVARRLEFSRSNARQHDGSMGISAYRVNQSRPDQIHPTTDKSNRFNHIQTNLPHITTCHNINCNLSPVGFPLPLAVDKRLLCDFWVNVRFTDPSAKGSRPWDLWLH